MLRSGFVLGVGGAAAILTMVALPSVRASADRLVTSKPVGLTAPGFAAPHALPGFRPVSLEISPVRSPNVHLATMPRPQPQATTPAITQSASEKEIVKPRRMTREGCEAPLSSLVGPEARRMVPGRCMT